METVLVTGIACLLLLLVPLVAGGWAMSLSLYRYATGQGPTPPFTEDDLQHALVPRRRLWLRK